VAEVDPPVAAPSEKSVPTPERATGTGPVCAPTVIVNTPLLGPIAEGINETAIVQLAPAARGELALQVVADALTTKSLFAMMA